MATLAAALTAARANDGDSSTGTALVTNNHGGYNVVEPSAAQPTSALITNNHGGYNVVNPSIQHNSLPFFGTHGYATKVIAEAHDEKPKFILVPVVEDVGHGSKIVVFKRVYFATAEEAEQAKGNMSAYK